jgi:NADH dehydrogenase
MLVVGATGSLGGRIVRGLLEGGGEVRALVRPGSDGAALEAAGAHVVAGDLKDAGSLDRACAGAEVVITTASATKRGGDTIEEVDLRGNQWLIEAARRAGVRHFILVSTLGAATDSPVPVFRAKGAAEERLRESGMTYTVLQPDAFMDVWFGALVEAPALAGRPVTLVGESRARHSFVAERDVAAFAVAATRADAARDATIVIGGPEPLTFLDVVRAYEAAAGRPIPVRIVEPGAPIPGMPEAVWQLAAWLESFDTPVAMEATARQYGITLTSVADFARSRLAGPQGEEASVAS